MPPCYPTFKVQRRLPRGPVAELRRSVFVRCIMAREIVRLSPQERELLTRHYDFYQSLASGSRRPTTPRQKHFVAVCRGAAGPATEHERAWLSFRRLMSLTKMRERDVVAGGF